MKIAVLGSAGSSVGKAPFRDARYDAWVEGRLPDIAKAHDFVPGDFQIWGCSPGCWAVIPRATRWFEVHRWETGVQWFSPQYCQFLRDFKGPVYTGGVVPEIPNHCVYPIDYIEEKFASYGLTSSLGLMIALAIDTIETVRENRKRHAAGQPLVAYQAGEHGIGEDELGKSDKDDVIGLWGVDMAASDEYAYQRPGCQWLVLEAMRRGIGVYLPPESDLMRPLPVYGISEWDHNYIKLTSRSKELSAAGANCQAEINAATQKLSGIQGEMHALNYFVSTWTSPYGMQPGIVLRQAEGTGLGSGITSYDGRPIERMQISKEPVAKIVEAMSEPDSPLKPILRQYASETGLGMAADEALLSLAVSEARDSRITAALMQPYVKPGESVHDAIKRIFSTPAKKAKKRRR